MKLPFLKFFVRDWQADPELRMCSLEARGFWLECLCIMHTAKRRGYLETPTGAGLNDDETSRLIGTFKGDVLRCKEELLRHGVPSVEEESGVWYCRRMVKDSIKSAKCSAAGKRGGGNPSYSKKEKPEARSHISLKATFKGGSDCHREMVKEVLNCRPEFGSLPPEGFFQAIHDAGENPRLLQNHKEFLFNMANSIEPPKTPAKTYQHYLQSSGLQKRSSKATGEDVNGVDETPSFQ